MLTRAPRRGPVARHARPLGRLRPMRRLRPLRRLLVTLLAVATLLAGCGDKDADSGRDALPPDQLPARAIIETSQGEIVLELHPEHAPRATSSFVRHARARFYDGMLVHRVIPGELFLVGRYAGDGTPKSPLFPAVPLEAVSEFGHTAGAVSLARYADPASGAAEFIVHARAHPELDGDYAVFARVVEGLDVVRAITGTPVAVRDGSPNWPEREIRIESVRLR